MEKWGLNVLRILSQVLVFLLVALLKQQLSTKTTEVAGEMCTDSGVLCLEGEGFSGR